MSKVFLNFSMTKVVTLSTIFSASIILSACGGGSGDGGSPQGSATASPAPVATVAPTSAPTTAPTTAPTSSPVPTTMPSSSPTASPTPEPAGMATGNLSAKISAPVVSGLKYAIPSGIGKTTENGSYVYSSGDNVTFSVGDIKLPAISAADITHFSQLVDVDEVANTQYINLVRFFYSLDQDADASNGIQISEDAHTQAQGMSLSFTSASFDTDVANLIANSGSSRGTLLSVDEARKLILEQWDTDKSCPRNSDKVGQTAVFDQFPAGDSYNVRGKARVLNDCTIEITGFSYNGIGASSGNGNVARGVFFYNLDNGAIFGEDMFGMVFNNTTVKVSMQVSQLESLKRLSVWCRPFDVDFGHAGFKM